MLVTRDDSRYETLLRKRFNKRFVGTPDSFYLATSAQQVAQALERAVHEQVRVTVQSGGHGLEGFVSDSAVRMVIDTSLMSAVSYDATRGALAVEAGATLGEAYRKLFLGWGVMLPAGQSPDIGVGGHVLGGAFGFHHRQYGLAVDHLYGVELVHVDASGRARVVTATRDDADPLRELWWAHTGCGGGNLGIVTRYYFRSPDTNGRDPTRCLPRAPASVTTLKLSLPWDQLDEADFSASIRNYGAWCEQNVSAESAFARLFSVLTTGRPPHVPLQLRALVAGAAEGEADRLLDEHVAAVTHGVKVQGTRERTQMAWLDFALNPFPDLFATGPLGVTGGGGHVKVKDALLRRRHTDTQVAIAYEHLTQREPELAGGSMGLCTYGGRINGLPQDATAYAQRDAVMDTSYGVGWSTPQDEERSLRWVREFYRDMFADTGGVPVPNAANEGALINHPDADLADVAWNRSGVPWHALYYKDNYARLQRVKQRWDPHDVFRHALSISR
jgi:hypothetical protein